jgi:hypothetical protein
MRIIDLSMGERNISRGFFMRLVHTRSEDDDIMIEVACQQDKQSILRMTGVNCQLVDEGMEREDDENSLISSNI